MSDTIHRSPARERSPRAVHGESAQDEIPESRGEQGAAQDFPPSSPPPLPPPVVCAAATRETPYPSSSFCVEPDGALGQLHSATQDWQRRILGDNWLLQRWHETPSWLTSLVVHLTVFITLASLVTPVSPKLGGPLLVVVASIAQHDLDQDAVVETAPVEIEQLVALDPPDDAWNRIDAAGSRSQPEEEALPKEQAQEDAETIAQNIEPSPPIEQPETIQQQVTPPVLAEHMPVLREGDAVMVKIEPYEPGSNSFAVQRSLDDVVERFIQYDIGRLRGAAGEQARREFDALGPAAIPALVRGLNRSAYINASCPVGVLSHKVETAIQQSQDPTMIRYAVENIGRGVPKNAPHAERLMQLHRRLQQQLSQVENDTRRIEQTFVSRGITPDETLVRYFRSLQQASLSDLYGALQHPSRSCRLAAVLEVSQRDFADVTDGRRIQFAQRLVPQLIQGDAEVRQEAHRALVNLNWGMEPPGSQPRGISAAQRWGAYWDAFSAHCLSEPQARSLLRNARIMARRGDRAAAARSLEQIVNNFPGTFTAGQATQQLVSLRDN